MNLILTLMHEYQEMSNQLAYHIRKHNIVGIDLYEQHQRQAAMKLIVALMDFHGFSVEDVTEETGKAESDV